MCSIFTPALRRYYLLSEFRSSLPIVDLPVLDLHSCFTTTTHLSALSNHLHFGGGSCYVPLASAQSVTNSGSGSRSPHAIPPPTLATYPPTRTNGTQISTYLSANLLLRTPAFAEELTARPAGASGLGLKRCVPFRCLGSQLLIIYIV